MSVFEVVALLAFGGWFYWLGYDYGKFVGESEEWWRTRGGWKP